MPVPVPVPVPALPALPALPSSRSSKRASALSFSGAATPPADTAESLAAFLFVASSSLMLASTLRWLRDAYDGATTGAGAGAA